MENSTAHTAGGPGDLRADALGDLRVLPDEILCAILEQLTPRDVGRLACVSRYIYKSRSVYHSVYKNSSSALSPFVVLVWRIFWSLVLFRLNIHLFILISLLMTKVL